MVKIRGLTILVVQFSFFYSASSSCAVLISCLHKSSFGLNKQKIDITKIILILHITLDAAQYILINLYNANTET